MFKQQVAEERLKLEPNSKSLNIEETEEIHLAEELTKDFLNAEDMCRMFFAAANQLLKQRDQINALNVFPVPDGDTGTNMYLTLKSSVDELSAIDHFTVGKVTSAVSMGALMGARGNS